MKLKKLTIPQRIIVLCAEIAAAYFLLGNVNHNLKNTKIQKNELSSAISQINELKDVVSQNKQLILKRDLLKSQWEKIKYVVSDEDKESYLLKQILNAADKTGILIIALKPSEVRQKEGLPEFSVDLNAECYQSNLGKFLNYLETKTNFIRIENLQISPTQTWEKINLIIKFTAFLPEKDKNTETATNNGLNPVQMANTILSEREKEIIDPVQPVIYAGIASRNVFMPCYVTLTPKKDEPPPVVFQLVGTIPGVEKSSAILKDLKTQQTMIVKVGETLDGGNFTVLEIRKSEVILKDKKKKETVLKLYD